MENSSYFGVETHPEATLSITSAKAKHGSYEVTADLTIKDFFINNSEQGDLHVSIVGDNSVQKYSVNSNLTLDDNISFSAVGLLDFTPAEPQMDIIFDFERFKLDAFSPLGKDVFNNIRGYAYGTANLTGPIANPVMEGDKFPPLIWKISKSGPEVVGLSI